MLSENVVPFSLIVTTDTVRTACATAHHTSGFFLNIAFFLKPEITNK